MKAVTIRITGKVQGVFFRASTKDEADRLGLSGIVRNEPDGSVYIEAEGSEEMILSFEQWCRKGPSRARVMTFVIEQSSPKGYVGFNIAR
jgi:acylphosphatase